MEAKKIRQQFIDFFKSKEHEIVASAPMVVKDDPTLMFTNAGMNQFKDLFLGNSEIKHPRIANSQKCLRVSGKHNDLEEVGVDTYHHTMFEMLGNWSFGEYFKKEAIKWAWELLTEVYQIPKDKLYVTVFEGDKKDGISMDQEAYDIWKSIIDEDRIILANKKDNFWEMGDTGPCGPCSEIHVDLRDEADSAKIPGKQLVNADHPQVVEIWNLVFIQFNRLANGSLKELPAKHIDTGMGFERLAMVLQGKKSNYDTDVFSPVIEKISSISGKKYTHSLDASNKADVAIRVIADHLRAVSFSIADGQLPSNNGAGYVIRRILRRAIRYGYSFLDQKEAFIYRLVEVLVKQMGDHFIELKKQQELITKVIKEEEESFLRTLDKGIQRFNNYLSSARDKTIEGAFAFELYDTYGFPIDLTELMATESKFRVDMAEFTVELEKQKERSRAAGKIEAGDWIVLREDDTEEFIGYDYSNAEVSITKYRKVIAKGEELVQLVFNLTPFYAEGGGQVGDTGTIEANGEKIEIIDTKKENNLIVHFVGKLPLDVHAKFKAVVSDKRMLTACNHSATHLLHQALRSILGTHVEQKGSLVNADYLRFDFSHFEKVNDKQLQEVEDFVNEKIKAAIPLQEYRDIPISKAQTAGAMMLFGEKYGNVVRMIEFGDSKELCGGIHVKNTSEIGLFKIKSEGSVAAGIRRIEALTNLGAANWLGGNMEILSATKMILNGHVSEEIIKQLALKLSELEKDYLKVKGVEKYEAPKKDSNKWDLGVLNSTINELSKVKVDKGILEALNTEKKKLAKEQGTGSKEKANQVKEVLLQKIEVVNGINFIAQKIDLDDSAAIKDLSFQLKGEIDNLFMVLGTEINGKPNLTVVVGDDLVESKNLNAGNIIRELAKEIQGGGGGQAFFSTAGGKDLSGLDKAISRAKEFVR